MKVKKETTIFTVLTGSHLYGTASESSDFDYKAVCLPPLDELLLNTKITNRKEKPEGLSSQDKMIAGGSETEYLPLQVFLNDFFDGQTYALEVAFAGKQGLFEVPAEQSVVDQPGRLQVQQLMSMLIDRFITRNVKKMVGYAVSQSKMYGLKTQRYTSLGEALRAFNEYGYEYVYTNEQRATLTLADTPALLAKLLLLPHVKQVDILNASGGTELAPALEICGKQYPLTNRINTIVKSIEKTVGNYGERVKEFDGEGVDWKALSHAIRITDQVLELCGSGTLTFPRANARFLADVKAGKLTLDEATAYLNDAFAKVDDAIAASVLRERTPELEASFREWKLNVLRDLYDVN